MSVCQFWGLQVLSTVAGNTKNSWGGAYESYPLIKVSQVWSATSKSVKQ